MELQRFDAVKALICFNGKYLVVKAADYEGGEFEVPGGRKEKNESDGVVLKREVKEETGLDVSIERMLNA